MIGRIQLTVLAAALAGTCLMAVTGCSHDPGISATAQKEMNVSSAVRAQETKEAIQRIQSDRAMPPQVRATLIASQTHQQHP